MTGDNQYARSQALREFVSAFVAAEGDLALERIDGEEHDFARIEEAITSLPFLSNKKMVVLSSPSKNSKFTEKVGELLLRVPDSTDLILYEPKFDKRSSLYKVLKKQTDFREFTTPDVGALARWASDEVKKRDGALTLADARYLVERVGANQQLIASELTKLMLYNSKVTRKTIDLLTEAVPQSTIFQLLDAAFAGNTKRALELYQEQRRLKVEPQQIIAMFAWQLHIMALIKVAGNRSTDEAAKQAKISPYVAGKTATLVRGITLDKLKQIIDELLSIDRRSKREALDLDDALKYFILNLCN